MGLACFFFNDTATTEISPLSLHDALPILKLARSAEEAADIAGHILGMKLVTPQTGPAGRIVKRVLIEGGLDIKRELYLGLLVDRASGRVVFMASAAGGMEIEELAKKEIGR